MVSFCIRVSRSNSADSRARRRPFWISPRQVLIIPVAAPHKDYAKEIASLLWDQGFYAEADLTDNTLPKKVRNGEIAQYNFIFGKQLGLASMKVVRDGAELTHPRL